MLPFNAGGGVRFGVFDTSNVMVANSDISGLVAASEYKPMSQSFIVTTTGSQVFKVRYSSGSAWTLFSITDPNPGNPGKSTIVGQKISGNSAVTGQSVESLSITKVATNWAVSPGLQALPIGGNAGTNVNAATVGNAIDFSTPAGPIINSGAFTLTSTGLTAVKAGRYEVKYNLSVNNNILGNLFSVFATKNNSFTNKYGLAVHQSSPVADRAISLNGSFIIDVAVGDTVELRVAEQNNASTLTYLTAYSLDVTQIGTTALTGVSVNFLAGATAAGALDNTTFGQTWNWSTATTTTSTSGLLALSANNLTTGSLLLLDTHSASSSAAALSVWGTSAYKFGADYVPTAGFNNNVDLGNTSRVRVNSTLTTFTGITGITAGVDGRGLTITNASSTQSFTIYNQHASSTAANRIITGTGADLVVAADATVNLAYDATSLRWRVVGGSGTSGSTNASATLGDFPTGGVVGTAAATVDTYNNINVAQTTTGQSLSLPNPTAVAVGTTTGKVITVSNTGSASFLMYTTQISASSPSAQFVWNGTAWNPVGGTANVAGEFGENNGIVNGQSYGAGTNDITGSSFTLPTAGTWEIVYNIAYFNSAGGGNRGSFYLTDSANTYVPNSTANQFDTTANYNQQISQTVRITVASPTTYKVRFTSDGGTFNIQNQNSAGSTSGTSKVTWKKISGNSAVTGQSVDYKYLADLATNSNVTVTTNSPFLFLGTGGTAGNIPYNAATGQFTLTAGKTYKLESSITMQGAGGANFQWRNDTAGALVGTVGFTNGDNGTTGNQTQPVAIYTFTPTVTTLVSVRNTTGGSVLFPTNVAGLTSAYVQVTQLGSTVTSGFSFSSFASAIAANILDNTNFDQIWNWSTETTGKALSLVANSLTTGTLLDLSSTGSSTANILHAGSATTTGLFVKADSSVLIGTSTLDTNVLNVNGGITLASTTPTATSSALYNNGGTLFWNGVAISSASTTGALSSLTAPTANNTITDNIGFSQTWNFGSNVAANSFTLAGTAVTAAGSILNVQSVSSQPITNGIVHFNFTGAHSNNGFQIDDATLGGTALAMNVNALTSGKGLSIASTNTGTTGNLLSMSSASTGNFGVTTTSGAVNLSFTGDHTGYGMNINDVSTASNTFNINNTAGYTGTGLINVTAPFITSGTILNALTSSNNAITGNLANISSTGNNAGSTGNLLNLNVGGATQIMKALNITDASTGALPATGAVSLNFTGAHTGTAFAVVDPTLTGTVFDIQASGVYTGAFLSRIAANLLTTGTASLIQANSITTGKAFTIQHNGATVTSAGANTGSLLDLQVGGAATAFTGSLANINMSTASAAGNTGSLLNINDSGAAEQTKLLTLNSGSTVDTANLFSLTSASAGAFASGGARFNFTGAHTGNGFQIDDVTATGNAAQINANSLTTGNGLTIASTNAAMTTGNLLNLSTGSTNANNNALKIVTPNSAGIFAIGTSQNSAANFDPTIRSTSIGANSALTFVGTVGTDGNGQAQVAIKPASDPVASPYFAIFRASSAIGFSVKNLGAGSTVWAGVNGNPSSVFSVNSSETTNDGLQVVSTTQTTGNLALINSTNAAATGNVFQVSSNSTGAVTNGLVRMNFTGAHTGNGFQVDDVTATGNVLAVNANSLTTGKGINLTSTATGLTGELLSVNTAATGAVSNGLIRFNSTGAHTGNLFQIDDTTSGGGLVGINGNSVTTGGIMTLNANALTSGGGLTISSTGAGLTGNLLSVTTNSTAASATGFVKFNFNGAHTGSGFSVNDSTVSANAMVISANAVRTGNHALIISSTGITANGTASSGTSADALGIVMPANLGVVNMRYIRFQDNASTELGSITNVNASTIAYNTTSDGRLKTDTGNTAPGLESLMNLPVHNFSWNKEPGVIQNGFFAQELYKAFPDAVTVGSDEVDASGKLLNPWSVDYGKVTPLLAKAIQDQQGLLGNFASSTATSTVTGLNTLIADVQAETSRDPIVLFTAKIAAGQAFLTDLVVARVTAIRGYFDEVFAGKVHTKTICIAKAAGGEVCVTGDQMQTLLNGGGSGGAGGGGGGGGSGNQPPVITVDPTTVSTSTSATTYDVSTGVSATDDSGSSVTVLAAVDGASPSPFSSTPPIDLSVLGVHTIIYSASDAQGAEASAVTRTVTIQ
jgi:hypothetical protein